MSEMREVLARAMRAQGKADPDEVFAKVDAGEPDDPDPEWATEEEQQQEPEALFGDGVSCERCGDTREVWNHETGDRMPCPECVPLVAPGRSSIGKFSDPAVSGAPETQREAAILVYPGSGSARLEVLSLIAERGDHGATDEEIEQTFGLRHQTASARRNELMNDGWVVDSKKRRRTSSGRMAVVWVLSEPGSAQYASVRAPVTPETPHLAHASG